VGAGIEEDRVEPTTFPAVLLQVVPEISVTAPAQSSLTGAGSSTQILKLPLDAGSAVEKTLINKQSQS